MASLLNNDINTLITLPPSVFEQIAKHLSPTDLVHLRQTCHALSFDEIAPTAAYHLAHLHFIPQAGLLFCLATGLFTVAPIDVHTQIVRYSVAAGGIDSRRRALGLYWSLFAVARVGLPALDTARRYKDVYYALKSGILYSPPSNRWIEVLANGDRPVCLTTPDKYPSMDVLKAFGTRRLAVAQSLVRAIQSIPGLDLDISKFKTYALMVGEACFVGDEDLVQLFLETFGRPTRGPKVAMESAEFPDPNFRPAILALLEQFNVPAVFTRWS
ncbi:uncharacterized protein EV422DRAFT_567975 [Fimicolochytrium jonesii]|uniref:uncharacterized protein n=1 Tax=Fimicolochytrium jonesii TaxID=1396493 RepID=UPI0022FEA832|nr:uncharacterized protein EV422DRAFT_567975 [Fimicolochytrium jonesii]KAI8820548.1 hypothetical protein EV422DRAFT_567975 [Fimicolochytrium jonesii]